jgi:hypothetical protein
LAFAALAQAVIQAPCSRPPREGHRVDTPAANSHGCSRWSVSGEPVVRRSVAHGVSPGAAVVTPKSMIWPVVGDSIRWL